MAEPITEFRGEHRFLSNFYPCRVTVDGITYPTAEHAFQAAKTLDYRERRRIADLPTPGEAKRAGRRLKLRDDWELIKGREMRKIIKAKFRRNPELAEKLLATFPRELVEGNTWGDRYWGKIFKSGKLHGYNHLGIILMAERDSLKLIGVHRT